MKRFRFRLQSLLLLRELRETQAATALAQKLEQQRRLERELAQAQACSEAARANLLQTEGKRFAPQDHAAALADFDRTISQERSKEKDVAAHAKILEETRQAWAQAGQALKAVKNLRGRAEDRHFLAAARSEQVEMDEVARRIAGNAHSLLS